MKHWVVALTIIAAAGCGDDSRDSVPSGGDAIVCEDLSAKRVARPAGDLYVTKQGNDHNDGRSYETAFATIQKGVDALTTGETLIIGPGEYFESVRRGDHVNWEYQNALGGPEADTVILAEIPGTVLLRGDIPAPVFHKLDGYRFVYVADFADDIEIYVINELDTLTVLSSKPNIEALDYMPGSFFHDRVAGKLYLSASDFGTAATHRYSLSTVQDHGLVVVDGTRVVIDGIAVRGFNMARAIFSWKDYTAYTVWGILLSHCRQCVVRNSRAFLNARGIGITSGNAKEEENIGGNVVEGCVAWANESRVSPEDTGGITLTSPRSDAVRDSVSYLNGGVGINIYGGGESAVDPANASVLSGNLSWGNEYADYKIKVGADGPHHTEYSVGLGSFSHSTHPLRCLVGDEVSGAGPDTIVLANEADLQLDEEFADPENHDFRLQSTSRFRGALDDGADRGPFSFEADVHFVSPSGNDEDDGLSMGGAWRTFAHAAGQLVAGDTLYVAPGSYDEDVLLTLAGTAAAPITIRGRGSEAVVLTGPWQVQAGQHLKLERLVFARQLRLAGAESISVDQSVFTAADKAIVAVNTVALRVTQSTFTGFAEAAIDLTCSVDSFVAGNLFDNLQGEALVMNDLEAVLYGDYNAFADPGQAWLVDGARRTLGDLAVVHQEVYSQGIVPEFASGEGIPSLQNELDFVGAGTFGQVAGAFRLVVPRQSLDLVLAPQIHSVSATTANIEWMTSLPAQAEIVWGETPAMTNAVSLSAQPFATYSLTGLQPDTTYYFRVNTLSVHPDLGLDADPVILEQPPLPFHTNAMDPPGVTYYVATTGDNDHDGLTPATPWRTVQYAADHVSAGDTVLIGGGTYHEQVYIKSTGAPGGTITFRNVPGERAFLDGAAKSLANGFIVASKAHLHFDGLYFRDYGDSNRWSAGDFQPLWGGDFNLYRSSAIDITRSLFASHDFQRRSVVARDVDQLRFDNIVQLDKFTAFYLHDTPNLELSHSVIARPRMYAFILYGDPAFAAHIHHTIITDSVELKASQNFPLFYGGTNKFVQSDCVYVLRDAHPPEWRELSGGDTVFDAPENYVDPLFVDPQFAAVEALIGAGVTVNFVADALVHEDVVRDFESFFVTHPEVTARGIGLQPTQFDANGVPD